MKTTVRSGLLLAIAFLAACGQSSGGSSKNAGTTDPTSPTAPAAPTASGAGPILSPEGTGARAFIRMLGAHNPGYDSLLANVAKVAVEVDGAPVALDYTGVQTMDLTNPDQAWRVASFAMPAAGSKVHVTVQLDEPAVWERAGASGELDTCGIPIEFTAPAEWFALRGHAVIVLDLSASIAGPTGSPVLLPNLQVLY